MKQSMVVFCAFTLFALYYYVVGVDYAAKWSCTEVLRIRYIIPWSLCWRRPARRSYSYMQESSFENKRTAWSRFVLVSWYMYNIGYFFEVYFLSQIRQLWVWPVECLIPNSAPCGLFLKWTWIRARMASLLCCQATSPKNPEIPCSGWQTKQTFIGHKEPYANIPVVIVGEKEESCSDISFRTLSFGDQFLVGIRIIVILADLGSVDFVSGNTTWIQRGTVLADWFNPRIDRQSCS